MLMRIATLSSMQASYTSSTMGFRCVGRCRRRIHEARAAGMHCCCRVLAAPPGGARCRSAANSLYHLDATLTSQDGAAHGLDVYRGHPVLVTMFYCELPGHLPADRRHAARHRARAHARSSARACAC